jgi:hypothetical protein
MVTKQEINCKRNIKNKDIMQKKLLSLLVLLMTAATGAWAGVYAGGWCGTEVTWQLTDDGVMTIKKDKGSGAMEDCSSNEDQPWYSSSIRNKITDVVIEAGVTHIGNYSFYGLTNLNTVSLPEGLLTIGHMAFRECSSLGSITIPASVTSIGQWAFALCPNLATVTFSAPSVGTLIQINARLKEIKAAGGVEAENKRIAGLARYFREKLKKSGLPLRICSDALPNAVTPLSPTNGVSANEIFLRLKDEYGIWVCPNGGEYKDTLFRVGHIGALTEKDYDVLIDAMLDMQKRGIL